VAARRSFAAASSLRRRPVVVQRDEEESPHASRKQQSAPKRSISLHRKLGALDHGRGDPEPGSRLALEVVVGEPVPERTDARVGGLDHADALFALSLGELREVGLRLRELHLLPLMGPLLFPLLLRRRRARGARRRGRARPPPTKTTPAATTTTTATASSASWRPPSPSSRPSSRTSAPPAGCAGTP
jgi:hypothetical protein